MKFKTDVNTKKIYPTSRLISRLMKMPVQANKAIVGVNAFAHASGIHQDGMLKHKQAFEIMQPSDVGLDETSIVLGARSGRAALKHRIEKLGYTVSQEKLNEIYPKFLEIADEKKEVVDEDIHLLMGRDVTSDKLIKINLVEVMCGFPLEPMATVRLTVKDKEYTASASGNGPVDAAYKAVNTIIVDQARIIKKLPVLKEFLIQAVTRGSDDICTVNTQLEKNGKMIYGYGSDTDIVVASVQAYVSGLNNIITK